LKQNQNVGNSVGWLALKQDQRNPAMNRMCDVQLLTISD